MQDKCHGKASAEMCNRSLEMPKKVSRPTTSRGLVKVAVRAPVVIRQMPCEHRMVHCWWLPSFLLVDKKHGSRPSLFPIPNEQPAIYVSQPNGLSSKESHCPPTIDDSGFSCRPFTNIGASPLAKASTHTVTGFAAYTTRHKDCSCA
jgi:hypothetical protein